MWKELIILGLIFAVVLMLYNSMTPSSECGVSVTRDAQPNGGIRIPDIGWNCTANVTMNLTQNASENTTNTTG